MRTCPICGKANGACGHQPLAFPPITALNEVNPVAETPIYLPKQHVKAGRGIAGYKGKNIVVVDPATKTEDKAATAAARKKAK